MRLNTIPLDRNIKEKRVQLIIDNLTSEDPFKECNDVADGFDRHYEVKGIQLVVDQVTSEGAQKNSEEIADEFVGHCGDVLQALCTRLRLVMSR